MAPTLIYFGIPARAEVARLLFTLGNIDFEDKRLTFVEWKESDLKCQCPFGQLPVLKVDGDKCLAQSAAIDHYVAALAGLLPQDPWQAAVADQAYFFCEDVWQTIYPSFKIQDPAEKAKAREELLAGALGDKLKLMTKLVEGRAGKFLTGDKITHGDIAVFCNLSTLQSGWLDGLPLNVLDAYPVLKEFQHTVATVPEIAAFYSKETDDIRVKGFKARA